MQALQVFEPPLHSSLVLAPRASLLPEGLVLVGAARFVAGDGLEGRSSLCCSAPPPCK